MSAFEIVHVRSEQSLSKIFKEDLEHGEQVLYRGQSNSTWELTSSFDRIAEGNAVARQRAFEAFFERFCRRYRMRYEDDLSEDQLTSLAQHYGLFTRLLDWTDKPYIALFFACTSEDAPTPSALYRLDRSKMAAEILDTEFSFVSAESSRNVRLNNQFGYLLKNMSNFASFEDYLSSRTDITNPLLTKYIISKRTRESIKKNLSQMGINYSSMFDGLEYLSKELNSDYLQGY